MAGIRNERLPSKAAFRATIESCAGRAYENPVSQRLPAVHLLKVSRPGSSLPGTPPLPRGAKPSFSLKDSDSGSQGISHSTKIFAARF